jgi:hypothetical protein
MANKKTFEITNSDLIESINSIARIGVLKKAERATMVFARNFNLLKKMGQKLDDSRVELWNKYFEPNEVVDDEKDERVHKFKNEWQGVLDAKVSVEVSTLKMKELELSSNPFAPVVLASLSWFITDFDDESEGFGGEEDEN